MWVGGSGHGVVDVVGSRICAVGAELSTKDGLLFCL